jgi:two-component system, NtrC family, sensor histidine kinase PilS
MPGFDSSLLAVSADVDTREQNHKIFQIYHIYRLALSLIFALSFKFKASTSPLGSVSQELFVQLLTLYAAANILAVLLLPLQAKAQARTRGVLYFATLNLDILLLTLISYTCGGVSSGLAHLLIIPVATGSILFGTRLGIFFASVGSIAAIYSESYLNFTIPDIEDYSVQAGLLGMMLFTSSLTLQYFGYRIRQKEQINRQQAASIHSLQQINQQVIQRMQTGIVVVTREGRIINSNDSARRLLLGTAKADNDALYVLPAVLADQLQAWLDKPGEKRAPFQAGPGGTEILASFSFLQSDQDTGILIFLEDYTQLSSRAQHLKLMSLGRLSASIAHEIRNPLGAISHACQLLDESKGMNAEDRRLLSIINTHSQRVNTIIENILEHSRPNHQPPEVFVLKPWLQSFQQRFRNSCADQPDFQLSIADESMTLRFNQSQLEQLLTNLCENAIRYSERSQGRPFVALRAYHHPLSGNPVLDVSDLGPGIPADDADHVFEPFFTTESKGTGLGLFICKEICEANQARIFHCRDNDEQSCFRIQFTHPDRRTY